jgi:signal transduction histidine kinase
MFELFHSARLRLTLGYLAIIMLLSSFFSLTLYKVSTAELDRSLNRQGGIMRNLAFDQLRAELVSESKHHLQLNLLYFNLFVLVIAGGLSYYLALRTLQPIEEALAAQHRFTADASHELRTPLTAMKTELEVALRDKQLTLGQSKSLHKSNLEEIEKLESLSNSLLTLAEQPVELSRATVEQCDLTSICETVVKRLKPLADKREIALIINNSGGTIEGDCRALTELLTIMLDNAIKYSSEKQAVTLTIETSKRQAIITIKDRGIGIEAIDLPHIFSRFYRAERSRSKDMAKGYGLGLSIAKRIIDAHHGSVEVDSEPTKGTVFTIKLPLKAVA